MDLFILLQFITEKKVRELGNNQTAEGQRNDMTKL